MIADFNNLYLYDVLLLVYHWLMRIIYHETIVCRPNGMAMIVTIHFQSRVRYEHRIRNNSPHGPIRAMTIPATVLLDGPTHSIARNRRTKLKMCSYATVENTKLEKWNTWLLPLMFIIFKSLYLCKIKKE